MDTWNDLPREVIEATTVNGFKGRLAGCKINLILCVTQLDISKEKGLISGKIRKSEAILLNMKINTKKNDENAGFLS